MKRPHQIGLCPICLCDGGNRIFSEQARLAFGERLASVHVSCIESLYDELRARCQDPLGWPELLRNGDDL